MVTQHRQVKDLISKICTKIFVQTKDVSVKIFETEDATRKQDKKS